MIADDFEPYPCPIHPDEMVTGECQDPYMADIYDDPTATMPNCPKCVHEAWCDI